MRRRGLLGLVTVFATVFVAMLMPAADGAVRRASAAAGEPAVTSPLPLPGEVVAAGPVRLQATVSSDVDVATVELTLDGAPVSVSRSSQDRDGAAHAGADVDVAAGRHEVRLRVTDAEGRQASRTWDFTATDATTTRHHGPDRYATARAVSRATYPVDGSAQSAVLARADDFADALAGAPLAAFVDGPLLLTPSDALSGATADELLRVLPGGATVHLLGGGAALSTAVADDVRDLGFTVERHAGEDRYATARAVAAALPASDAVFIASGTSFPDALAASAPAARDGTPILLTRRDELPAPTRAALRGAGSATLVGGPAVIAPAVADEVRGIVAAVDRVAGEDRYETAVAVLEAFFDAAEGVSLASGVAFPDALTGTRHAAALAQPLLLTPADVVDGATDAALRAVRPERIDVYGGPVAVGNGVVRAAWHAVVDGPGAPRVVETNPVEGAQPGYLDAITVRFDSPIDAVAAHLRVGDAEVIGRLDPEAPDRVTFAIPGGVSGYVREQEHPARVTVVAEAGRRRGHHAIEFTYLEPDPWFATVGGVDLHLPSRNVELIGYHQSSHDGARELEARDTATERTTLPSRGRGTGRHTAADIVADPRLPVYAPVDGVVVRAGTYRLYCDHEDHYLVIEPDARAGYEVKMLHFEGLSVAAGDRVAAGTTQVGTRPRVLPFESQVDEYSGPDDWPHIHVEVVDTSIPDRPGGGGC